MKSRFDSPHGEVRDRYDLIIGQALDIPEDDQDTVIVFESRDLSTDRRLEPSPFEDLVGASDLAVERDVALLAFSNIVEGSGG